MSPWFVRLAMGILSACVVLSPVWAHDFRIGDLVIDHPYATPSLPGVGSGAVYIKVLRNTGRVSDRLIAASSKVADRVLLHSMQVQGEVMRMRAVSAIEVPAQSEVRMGHANQGLYHLMLEGLKAPLKDGDRFELTLRFENAGERTVKVWVQTPRGQHKSHAPAHEPQQQTQGLSDAQQIEQVMKKLFDKPQSPLKVASIAMEGEYAVAGWLQDGRGGRALLQKRQGQWSITVCAGDGLKHAQTLEQAGMKPAAAARLFAKMAAQEARLPADVLKKFASFEGVVKIDAHAAHGHGHGAPASKSH